MPAPWPIEFTIAGTVAGQGSKRFVGVSNAGRGILIEQSTRVKPWRQAVVAAFKRLSVPMIKGAVEVEMTFSFARPKSAKRKYPSVAPDADKCVRATSDALTQAGAWEDDARVVILSARKVYATDAFPPGALIRLRPAP